MTTHTAPPEELEPRRFHITEGHAFDVETSDGLVHVGPGWLAITEAEYAILVSRAPSPEPSPSTPKLPPAAYVTSEKHLSGWRVTLGYTIREDADAAHEILARQARDGADRGLGSADGDRDGGGRVSDDVVASVAPPTPSPADREAIARIIDPTAWKIDCEGYAVPQEHADAALAKADAILAQLSRPAGWEPFQARVAPWMAACFGPEISSDRLERGDRLLEETFELLQSGAYPVERVAALRDYVWGRPAGEPAQEVGGVMVTLAAYCLAFGLDMHEAGEIELARIWTKVEQIRAKQAAKPTGSALPVAVDRGEMFAVDDANQSFGAVFSTYAGERWRHAKRGGTYVLPFGRCEAGVQTAEPLQDGDVVLVYIADDGMIWVRPPHEFYDGRFEQVSPEGQP